MTIDQIAALGAGGESETLEFKETTGTRREGAMTLCAFLNQRGGHVLFGVTRAGIVVGQQVSERTLEELGAALRQIHPRAFPTIERVGVGGHREVIMVSTSKGTSRPYTFRGIAYRRVGNTTLAISADEYNRMLFERMHSEQRWENQAAAEWSVDDLDEAEIRRPLRKEFGAVVWKSRRVGSRPTCCEGSVFCAMACCFGRRPYCSATGNGWKSTCRNACSA